MVFAGYIYPGRNMSGLGWYGRRRCIR